MTRRSQPAERLGRAAADAVLEAVAPVAPEPDPSDVATLDELVANLARHAIAISGRIERAAADVAGNGAPTAANDLWRFRIELSRCRLEIAGLEHGVTQWCNAREAEVSDASYAADAPQ